MAVTVNVDQLGAELKRRRGELGYSLRAVEQRAQISAATLSRIERGSVPDVAVLERLAEWLGVNVCAAGSAVGAVDTDEDLKRMIVLHLRRQNISPSVAQAIVKNFDLVMRMELERAGLKSRSATSRR